VVDPVTGTVLWDRNSATPVTPASTTKVLTSAAALLSLDHNLRLSTKIVQGADPGTVILVGGGDTTITNLPLGTDSPLYPGAAHVDDLVAQVKKAAPGVKKVQVDLTLFKGATTAPGWEAGDAPSTYATQMSPVMADGGRINPKDNNSQRTANAGSALAQSIASKLGASAGGQATAPKDAKVLGEVKSAPLTELVSDLMELSDDVLAEAVARQVALANGEEASYAGGARATIKVLKDHGFDVSGERHQAGARREDAAMKYMILTYGSQQDYDGMAGVDTGTPAWSGEDFAAMGAFMNAFNTELEESGELVETRALAAPVHTRRFGAKDGTPFVTDGPYAETQEVLAGYWIVECESFDRANEIAARLANCPAPAHVAANAYADIRPIIENGDELGQ